MERRLQKRRVLPISQQCFHLEDLTQIDWVAFKKQNRGRAYETKIEDKENQFDYCFEFETNAKSRFVRLSFNQLSKFKRLLVAYFTIYQKQNKTNVYFGNVFFTGWK